MREIEGARSIPWMNPYYASLNQEPVDALHPEMSGQTAQTTHLNFGQPNAQVDLISLPGIKKVCNDSIDAIEPSPFGTYSSSH